METAAARMGKGYEVASPWLNPVCRLQVLQYKRDLVVKFQDRSVPSKPGAGVRGEITRWSRPSIRRFMLMVKNASCEWISLITLTYPREYTADGKAVKKHLNSFLQYLRRLGLAYCWVLEFQERGAPHFHILVWASSLRKRLLYDGSG